MPLALDENTAKYQIRAYEPGKIKINDQEFTQSLIVSANELIHPWAPQNIKELTSEHLLAVLPLKPEVLLLGTGEQPAFLPVDLYGELINHGIGVEVMHTAAACRTYNALTSENRLVAAALVIR